MKKKLLALILAVAMVSSLVLVASADEAQSDAGAAYTSSDAGVGFEQAAGGGPQDPQDPRDPEDPDDPDDPDDPRDPEDPRVPYEWDHDLSDMSIDFGEHRITNEASRTFESLVDARNGNYTAGFAINAFDRRTVSLEVGEFVNADTGAYGLDGFEIRFIPEGAYEYFTDNGTLVRGTLTALTTPPMSANDGGAPIAHVTPGWTGQNYAGELTVLFGTMTASEYQAYLFWTDAPFTGDID
jgi:hypothetical protein